MCDWAFTQKGTVEDSVEFDPINKEIKYNVTNQTKHAYNQNSMNRSKSDRMWELLLDNQSTRNVIINSKLLNNIRKCRWTLRLQTQAGECIINEVGDMKGVGLVCHYPGGVANMLSQFRMIVYSKWRMTYDAVKFHRSGNIDDLNYDVTTPQCIQCKF